MLIDKTQAIFYTEINNVRSNIFDVKPIKELLIPALL